MTTISAHLSPLLCLDALSEHPDHAAVMRLLHPAMRNVEPILPDVAEWSLIELTTYAAIAADKPLHVVRTVDYEAVQRLAHVVAEVRKWAAVCGRKVYVAPNTTGAALRFKEVGE